VKLFISIHYYPLRRDLKAYRIFYVACGKVSGLAAYLIELSSKWKDFAPGFNPGDLMSGVPVNLKKLIYSYRWDWDSGYLYPAISYGWWS
jgi:hypothetical protein